MGTERGRERGCVYAWIDMGAAGGVILRVWHSEWSKIGGQTHRGYGQAERECSQFHGRVRIQKEWVEREVERVTEKVRMEKSACHTTSRHADEVRLGEEVQVSVRVRYRRKANKGTAPSAGVHETKWTYLC